MESVSSQSLSESDEPVVVTKIPSPASHLENTEIKVLREDLASKKRKVEEMEEDMRTLRRSMKAVKNLYDESAQVRRFHADSKHCADDEVAPWMDVGTAISNNIIVPAEMTGNKNVCVLKCSEYYKDILHALWGVDKIDGTLDRSSTFKLVSMEPSPFVMPATPPHRCAPRMQTSCLRGLPCSDPDPN